MLIIAPQATDEPGPDWGKAELGKGLFVYPAHGLLWRTAKLLEARERIVLPEDSRELVEGAYDENVLPTPQALAPAQDNKESRDLAEKSLATANILDFFQGYGANAAGGQWYDDRITPTRLGEERMTLRLVKVVDGELSLWAGDGTDAGTCAGMIRQGLGCSLLARSVPRMRGDDPALAAGDAKTRACSPHARG